MEIYVSCINLKFPSHHIKQSRKRQVKLILIIYFILPNISEVFQYVINIKLFYILHIKCWKPSVYFMIKHFQFGQPHILWSHVAKGLCNGQCRSRSGMRQLVKCPEWLF